MYVMLNEIANVEDSVKFALVTKIQVYVVREYNRSENNVHRIVDILDEICYSLGAWWYIPPSLILYAGKGQLLHRKWSGYQ